MPQITKNEWQEYKEVQETGMFNMLEPRAREMTTLSKEKWLYIIKNYNELTLIYEKGENK